MFVFGFARDAKTRRPVGANFLEAVQVLGVVVLILSILRLFCLWLCQKLQNANYFRVVKHLLKKEAQIIALKHFFVQNGSGLADDCTEALNESIVRLGGKDGEHTITLRA